MSSDRTPVTHFPCLFHDSVSQVARAQLSSDSIVSVGLRQDPILQSKFKLAEAAIPFFVAIGTARSEMAETSQKLPAMRLRWGLFCDQFVICALCVHKSAVLS